MKAVFTILFSLLLVAGQALCFEGTAASASRPACACSTCAKGCCVGKNPPATPVQPVAPASTFSQESWQLIITQALCFLELPQTRTSNHAISFSAPLNASTIPLYERNCSYLI